MKILIAGGGKIGASLTEQLTNEGHELTVIDCDSDVLENLIGRYDVIGVTGNAASMSVLETAGVKDADLFIAATDMDEVNMLACMTAHGMNSNLTTIGRIRNPE
ncbi:MAG: NAD-binding protein, partial [Solobacterium sp.]|nr:NAD-binding protein [Solobacterium sp.]